MVIAVNRALRQRQERLHEEERPIAQLTALYANGKRDPKKQRAYQLKDFCLFAPSDSGDSADGAYGAAALALAEKGKMPTWALFCFNELRAGAEEGYVPDTCAFIASDAMLLHPTQTREGWTGLLIAQESASERYRTFTDDNGNTYHLRVPLVHTKVIAKEGVTLFS